MNRLSDAVARVVRREIADRQISNQEFAAAAGKTKTTAWRQIEGISRMSIDDVEDYAVALGWTLDQLLDEAKALQSERAADEDPAPVPAIPAEIDAMLSKSAKKDLRRTQQRSRKSSTSRRTG